MANGTAITRTTTTIAHAAPSCPSATALVRGDPGAIGAVLVHTAGRAALLAMGMALAGHAEKHLARDALAGAVMLEVLMVLNASRATPSAASRP